MRTSTLDHKTMLASLTTVALIVVLTFVDIAMAVAPSIELTSEEQAYLDKKGELTLAADPVWPPYEFLDAKGEYKGIGADIIALLSKRLGVPFSVIRTKSWVETLAVAKAGTCDILPILNTTPERARFLDFTSPYFHSQIVLIGKEDVWLENGLSDIPSQVIAVVDGHKSQELMHQDHPGIATYKAQSTMEALIALDKDKAYALLASLEEASYLIKENQMSDLRVIGHTPYSNALRIGVRKDDAILLSIMQKGIESLTKTEIEDIRHKWITEDDHPLSSEDSRLLIMVTGILAALIAGILLFRKSRN
ncbi:transporter substrate-binding domain-containing protein [Pseudodesulfovibrio sp. zrk46]|uniref:transporter substrate-binding domain-containing protein n=1 Tax=Pseudodesulfovibrio sp. zrk46 TaxID=2725288 RepID=UPI001448F290|nr:transporter substrate-binding domain-containing protein [Pseudodesulfovibrio sp. zrk46]QJB56341.1 transporter substrate-binding domain-containing protein [Pseudodesulfovibrio sp. zrk46]